MKTVAEYAIFSNGKPMFFPDREFTQSCFYAVGSVFCEKPDFNTICEDNIFNSMDLKLECLEKMDVKNTVTKIDSDLYFMIFTPIIIDVICDFGKYAIRLSEHAKIVNNVVCSLNSSNFRYNPNNTTMGLYSIFFLDNDISLWETDNMDIFDIILIAIGFIVSNFTTILFCVRKIRRTEEKFKDIDLRSENASSIHAYATIDDL